MDSFFLFHLKQFDPIHHQRFSFLTCLHNMYHIQFCRSLFLNPGGPYAMVVLLKYPIIHVTKYPPAWHFLFHLSYDRLPFLSSRRKTYKILFQIYGIVSTIFRFRILRLYGYIIVSAPINHSCIYFHLQGKTRILCSWYPLSGRGNTLIWSHSKDCGTNLTWFDYLWTENPVLHSLKP